jgi:GT2 family glycosyltransferase
MAVAEARNQIPLKAILQLTDHSPYPANSHQLSSWRTAAQGLDLCYRHDPSNPGFGLGHNTAFQRIGSAEYFLVANPDLEFKPDSLANGIGFLLQNPEHGLLAPGLLEPDGNLRPACFRYPDVLTLFARLIGGSWAKQRNHRYECRDWDAHQPRFNPPLISGCCMLFRSHHFKRLKGFDPAYFLYFEDFDLSWRAQKRQLSVYCPNMQVAHAGGAASRKGWRHQLNFLHSALRFFTTHGWHPPK